MLPLMFQGDKLVDIEVSICGLTDKQAAQFLHIDEETGFSKSACASEG